MRRDARARADYARLCERLDARDAACRCLPPRYRDAAMFDADAARCRHDAEFSMIERDDFAFVMRAAMLC